MIAEPARPKTQSGALAATTPPQQPPRPQSAVLRAANTPSNAPAAATAEQAPPAFPPRPGSSVPSRPATSTPSFSSSSSASASSLSSSSLFTNPGPPSVVSSSVKGPSRLSEGTGSSAGSGSGTPPSRTSPSGSITPQARRSASPLTLARRISNEHLLMQLIRAVESNDVLAVMLQLSTNSAHLDVNGYSEHGDTALALAAHNGNEMIAILLLQKGAQVDRPNLRGGYTPLHRACWSGHIKIVSLLISQDADVNVKDADGYTPLHWAAWNGKKECVEVLLRAGARANAQDRYGYTPLHRAVMDGHDECVFLLMNLGNANCNAVNELLDTPLHVASKRDQFDTLRLLLRFSCDVTLKNLAGQTALGCAVSERCRRLLADPVAAASASASPSPMLLAAPTASSSQSSGADEGAPQPRARAMRGRTSSHNLDMSSSALSTFSSSVEHVPEVDGSPAASSASEGVVRLRHNPARASLPNAAVLFSPPGSRVSSTTGFATSAAAATSHVRLSTVRRWSIHEVCTWLASLGFPQYALTFEENEIDGEALLFLGENDYAKLGIESRDRSGLRAAVASLGT